MPEYTPILSLNIQHSYFPNNLCKEVLLEPTQSSRDVIENHRLRIISRPTGLDLYAPLNSLNQLAFPIDASVSFQFSMKSKSADFYFYTALPPKDSNGQYKISNQTGNLNNPATFAAYGGLLDGNQQEIAGSFGSLTQTYRYRFSLEGGKSGQTIALGRSPVKNASIGSFTFAKAISDDAYDPSSQTWELTAEQQLKLSTPPPTQNTSVITHYPVPSKESQGNLGLLDISLGKSFTQKSDAPLSYTVSFKAQKAQWQYLIICPASKALSKVDQDIWSIKTANNTIYEVNITELSQSTNPELPFKKAHLVWSRLKESHCKQW